jgi:hypothetical protein
MCIPNNSQLHDTQDWDLRIEDTFEYTPDSAFALECRRTRTVARTLIARVRPTLACSPLARYAHVPELPPPLWHLAHKTHHCAPG